MVTRVIPVDPFDLVIFGGTGDLARRKIIPGLYRRFVAGQIPVGTRIIGAARGALTDADYRDLARKSIGEFVQEKSRSQEKIESFVAALHFLKIDAMAENGWDDLAKMVRKDVVQVFYFSVGPRLFGPLAKRLNDHNISADNARIVVEKPFGHDLASAQALNQELAEYFDESQIYRIDHYLGKETVQNLMAVRFANILFEPLWNSQYVDHIQITVSETVGVGGRGAYYDKSGAMRDMVQNHLMQLVCLIAMEPPAQFDPDSVRDEKLKVIRALDTVSPNDIVRGQYRAQGDNPSYIEDSENPESKTESFLAMKLKISNWRWNGTPFYLRTGKRLRARKSEIAVVFKDPPHMIFGDNAKHRCNQLLIHLQPNEGMDMRVTIKEPGPGGMRLMDVPLDMSFAEALGEAADNITDAYERLVMDVIRGDQTLFMRGDEVEAAWAWTDPMIEAWKARGDLPKPYDPGSSGPEDALMLMHKEGRRWREIT
ncbi:MAG TPA: glucose-6-phosphate dehydrogenase [Rhodobacteraceae bacterium]|jgi:glucose-6-phosphate 1-dehydrogenase|nr:glucose-6-phosphate dehydrogenase [Paracoccaceae bacterium]